MTFLILVQYIREKNYNTLYRLYTWNSRAEDRRAEYISTDPKQSKQHVLFVYKLDLINILYTWFCNCLLDYDYLLHIVNFAILYIHPKYELSAITAGFIT
jgi:hypothetical protein